MHVMMFGAVGMDVAVGVGEVGAPQEVGIGECRIEGAIV
jgi:hypothetical protein